MTDNSRKVIIVTGAPAVGKSSMVAGLREIYPQGFFLDVDEFRPFVGKVDLQAHDLVYEQTLTVVAGLVNVLLKERTFLPIFIFDCLNPKRMEWLIDQIGGNCEVLRVVLWLPNEILEERMRQRTGHFYSDIPVAINLNNWIGEMRGRNEAGLLFLDRAEMNVAETVERIRVVVGDVDLS